MICTFAPVVSQRTKGGGRQTQFQNVRQMTTKVGCTNFSLRTSFKTLVKTAAIAFFPHGRSSEFLPWSQETISIAPVYWAQRCKDALFNVWSPCRSRMWCSTVKACRGLFRS